MIVAKGKRTTVFDVKNGPPGDATLAKMMLGPTGNLRAPTIRVGETLLVGFNEEAYSNFIK